MEPQDYLTDVIRQLKKLKDLADKAIDQIGGAQLFLTAGADSNSIAIIMKHLAGNMRSRWTDFLTTDGEKADRFRDREFVIEEGETQAQIFEQWEQGWQCVLTAISSLSAEDLDRTVTIRSAPHSVLEAIQRQLTHYAYHVGQIVFLARYFAGPNWHSLSIPRGKSAEFEVSKEGKRYNV